MSASGYNLPSEPPPGHVWNEPGSDIRFDLALGLGVIGSTADTLHVSIIEPFGRVARYLRLTSVRSLIA